MVGTDKNVQKTMMLFFRLNRFGAKSRFRLQKLKKIMPTNQNLMNFIDLEFQMPRFFGQYKTQVATVVENFVLWFVPFAPWIIGEAPFDKT